MSGTIEIDYEMADSPGELWTELTRVSPTDEPSAMIERSFDIRNSSFFEYVANADAIFYLLPAELVINSSLGVKRLIDQFLALIEILQDSSLEPAGRATRRLALVISKADQFNSSQLAVLRYLLEDVNEFSIALSIQESHAVVDAEFVAGVSQIERLLASAKRNSYRLQVFVVSAVASAFTQRSLVAAELLSLGLSSEALEEFDASAGDLKSPAASLKPIEWVISTADWR
jgi:hypothetical protein